MKNRENFKLWIFLIGFIFYSIIGILLKEYVNETLGWIMGYRLPYITVDPSGNVASAILDLNGPKYLILVLDDYNQNHVNNSIVSITQLSNKLKIPSYYSPDLPYTCVGPTQSNLSQLISGSGTQNGLLIAGKFENDYSKTQVVLPSAPRTLTNAQLYSINEINRNNNNLTNMCLYCNTEFKYKSGLCKHLKNCDKKEIHDKLKNTNQIINQNNTLINQRNIIHKEIKNVKTTVDDMKTTMDDVKFTVVKI